MQNLLAAADVRQRHHDLAVKTARTQQRRIQHVGTVGCGNHDDALAGFKTVHLHQHLVQGLLALIVAAAQARAPLAADRVNFINEDDARRVLLGVLEHVADAGRAHPHEHFNEVRTGNAEERHLGLAGDGARQQGLTGTRGTDHQHAARNAAAELLEFGGIAQEVHQFLDVFLGFVAARHVSESDTVGVFIEHAGAGFAEIEGPALAAALHLAHEEHPDPDQQQHREPGHEHAHQQRGLFLGFAGHLNAVLHQVSHQPQVAGRRNGIRATISGRDVQHFTLDVHFLDATGFGLFHELRV